MGNGKGKVYLIGAGPGDPELITVKGKAILERCDAVIYDYLTPSEFIICAPPHIEMHFAGKRAGHVSAEQDDINELMVKLALEGKIVARLKGGDPFLFGRGGEEAEYLRRQGIDFEVIPGVTAGTAVPAYAGIPITDRRYSSYTVLATGHKSKIKEKSDVPWGWLAKMKGGTLVIYMGVGELEQLSRSLIENGLSPDTPSAIIERGTESTQRIVSAPLSELAGRAVEAEIGPPALIVIGKVVDLRAKLAWFEKVPLFGVRVMVTRPVELAIPLYRRLRELGAEVLPCPTIAATEHIDEEAWDKVTALLKNRSDERDRWLAFTSRIGVRYFFEQLKRRLDIRLLAGLRIAAIGEGTAGDLRRAGLIPDFIPDKATVADLAAQLIRSFDMKEAEVIRVRGNLSEPVLENACAKAGATVIPLRTYTVSIPRWPDGIKEKLLDRPPQAIIFTSSSTVDGLFEILSDAEIKSISGNAKIFSIGPSTAQRLRQRGLPVDRQCESFSIEALIDELLAEFDRKGRNER